MPQYVAFLRAINVAGHASVRMTSVAAAFAAAGCQDVRTVIQSGNIIFSLPNRDVTRAAERIRRALRRILGQPPVVILRTGAEMARIVRDAPFAPADSQYGAKLYVAFLAQAPHTRSGPRFPLISSAERLEAIGKLGKHVFIVSRRKPNGFFGFPNNFIEAQLGVEATTRHWSTVTRVTDLLRKKEGEGEGRLRKPADIPERRLHPRH